LRLFFALWPEADIAERLRQAADPLNLAAGTRRVNPKNFHMTLAFVGEVADARLAVLQQIGQSLRAPCFSIVCDSMEYWREPRVIVAAAQNSPPGFHDLACRLGAAIGLPPAPLRAHVTLARKVAQAPVLQAMSPIVWRATHFSLIRSETGGAESAYTVQGTWPLLYEMQNP
jgi:RNA 2',3'-cyclic 3'-phosphodiesterase